MIIGVSRNCAFLVTNRFPGRIRGCLEIFTKAAASLKKAPFFGDSFERGDKRPFVNTGRIVGPVGSGRPTTSNQRSGGSRRRGQTDACIQSRPLPDRPASAQSPW